jgi:hypothetical protein
MAAVSRLLVWRCAAQAVGRPSAALVHQHLTIDFMTMLFQAAAIKNNATRALFLYKSHYPGLATMHH